MRRLLPLAALVTALAAAAPASAATFFHSPSGNIRCVIDRTSFTRCDITNRDFLAPAEATVVRVRLGKQPGAPLPWSRAVPLR